MELNKYFWIAIVATIAVSSGYALTPSGASVTLGTGSGFGGSTPASITINSGYTYSANVNGNQSTDKWAGIYGNATGNIMLSDSNGNQFFVWSGATPIAVYLSSASNPDWSTVTAANSTDMPSSLTTGTDSWSNTFTGSGSPSGSSIITSAVPAATPLPTASSFQCYSAKDGSGNLIWAAKILSTAATTFNNEKAQYEAILPGGTYNVWLELS